MIATAIYFVFDILDELTFAGSWSRLVSMDRVSVDRDWRGWRFGPFLVARALRQLSGDDAIAACHPAPFELPIDHPDRDRERVRLARIWEQLGFQRHRDGVFVCDPTAGELDRALDELTKVVLG